MDSLTRLMREATELAPQAMDPSSQVNVDEVWRRGRRRRTLRTAASLAGALVAVALVASVVLGSSRVLPDQLLPADRGGEKAGVTAYPQRIGHQWWTPSLGDRPGPVAGLIEVEDLGWYALASDGSRHSLSDATHGLFDVLPAVSPDGRRVAYLRQSDQSWVVRDLPSGRVQSFSIGPEGTVNGRPRDPKTRSYRIRAQSPSYFSPSGDRLVVPTNDGPVVIDMATGSLLEVSGMDQPAGWLDEDTLVGRTIPADIDTSGVETAVDVVAWDRRSGATDTLGRIEFGNPPVVQPMLDGQWWGTLRRDGTLWLSVSGVDGVRHIAGVALPALSPVDITGRSVPKVVWNLLDRPPVDWPTGDGLTWHGTTPTAVTDGPDGRQIRPMLASDSSDSFTVVDPSIDMVRIIWAGNAINGTPTFSLFGTQSGYPFWWWKEIVLGFTAFGAVLWWRRRHGPSRGVAAPWQSERRE